MFVTNKMTRTQRSRYNLLILEEALSRGKKIFKGVCKVHSETDHSIILRKDGKIEYRCLKCREKAAIKRLNKRSKSSQELLDWKRERAYHLQQARRIGNHRFVFKCKIHGLTWFRFKAQDRIACSCVKCHSARVMKNRKEKKLCQQQNLLLMR